MADEVVGGGAGGIPLANMDIGVNISANSSSAVDGIKKVGSSVDATISKLKGLSDSLDRTTATSRNMGLAKELSGAARVMETANQNMRVMQNLIQINTEKLRNHNAELARGAQLINNQTLALRQQESIFSRLKSFGALSFTGNNTSAKASAASFANSIQESMTARLIGLWAVMRQIDAIKDNVKTLDLLSASLVRITGSAYQAGKAMEFGKDVAQIYGASLKDVAGVIVELSRTGMSIDSVKYLTASLAETRLLLATSTGKLMDMKDMAQHATSISQQLELGAVATAETIRKMAELDVQTATNFDKLGAAMTRFAASGRVARLSVDEMLMAATALTEAGFTGEIAGTSLNTIFTRPDRTVKESEFMAKWGVSILETKDGVSSLNSSLEQLTKTYVKLKEAGRFTELKEFIELYAGTRQAPKLIALLDQLSRKTEHYQQIMKDAVSTEGDSYLGRQQGIAALMDTIEFRKTNFQNTLSSQFTNPFFTELYKQIFTGMEKLSNVLVTGLTNVLQASSLVFGITHIFGHGSSMVEAGLSNFASVLRIYLWYKITSILMQGGRAITASVVDMMGNLHKAFRYFRPNEIPVFDMIENGVVTMKGRLTTLKELQSNINDITLQMHKSFTQSNEIVKSTMARYDATDVSKRYAKNYQFSTRLFAPTKQQVAALTPSIRGLDSNALSSELSMKGHSAIERQTKVANKILDEHRIALTELNNYERIVAENRQKRAQDAKTQSDTEHAVLERYRKDIAALSDTAKNNSAVFAEMFEKLKMRDNLINQFTIRRSALEAASAAANKEESDRLAELNKRYELAQARRVGASTKLQDLTNKGQSPVIGRFSETPDISVKDRAYTKNLLRRADEMAKAAINTANGSIGAYKGKINFNDLFSSIDDTAKNGMRSLRTIIQDGVNKAFTIKGTNLGNIDDKIVKQVSKVKNISQTLNDMVLNSSDPKVGLNIRNFDTIKNQLYSETDKLNALTAQQTKALATTLQGMLRTNIREIAAGMRETNVQLKNTNLPLQARQELTTQLENQHVALRQIQGISKEVNTSIKNNTADAGVLIRASEQAKVVTDSIRPSLQTATESTKNLFSGMLGGLTKAMEATGRVLSIALSWAALINGVVMLFQTLYRWITKIYDREKEHRQWMASFELGKKDRAKAEEKIGEVKTKVETYVTEKSTLVKNITDAVGDASQGITQKVTPEQQVAYEAIFNKLLSWYSSNEAKIFDKILALTLGQPDTQTDAKEVISKMVEAGTITRVAADNMLEMAKQIAGDKELPKDEKKAREALYTTLGLTPGEVKTVDELKNTNAAIKEMEKGLVAVFMEFLRNNNIQDVVKQIDKISKTPVIDDSKVTDFGGQVWYSTLSRMTSEQRSEAKQLTESIRSGLSGIKEDPSQVNAFENAIKALATMRKVTTQQSGGYADIDAISKFSGYLSSITDENLRSILKSMEASIRAGGRDDTVAAGLVAAELGAIGISGSERFITAIEAVEKALSPEGKLITTFDEFLVHIQKSPTVILEVIKAFEGLYSMNTEEGKKGTATATKSPKDAMITETVHGTKVDAVRKDIMEKIDDYLAASKVSGTLGDALKQAISTGTSYTTGERPSAADAPSRAAEMIERMLKVIELKYMTDDEGKRVIPKGDDYKSVMSMIQQQQTTLASVMQQLSYLHENYQSLTTDQKEDYSKLMDVANALWSNIRKGKQILKPTREDKDRTAEDLLAMYRNNYAAIKEDLQEAYSMRRDSDGKIIDAINRTNSKEYWQAMKEAAEQQVTNIRNLALMKQSDRPSDLKYQSQINRELKKLVLEVAQADVNIRNAELTAALQGQELGSNILKTKRRFDYGLMTPTKQLSQLAEDVDLEIENVMLKLTGGSLVPADIDWSQFRDNYVKTQAEDIKSTLTEYWETLFENKPVDNALIDDTITKFVESVKDLKLDTEDKDYNKKVGELYTQHLLSARDVIKGMLDTEPTTLSTAEIAANTSLNAAEKFDTSVNKFGDIVSGKKPEDTLEGYTEFEKREIQKDKLRREKESTSTTQPTVYKKDSIHDADLSKIDKNLTRWHEYISKAAETFKVPESLIYALMKQESGGNPMALSSAGARGLMQFMPSTARAMGLKVTNVRGDKTTDERIDPEKSIYAGVQLMASLLNTYKHLADIMNKWGTTQQDAAMMVGYNAGSGKIPAYLSGKTIPEETARYIPAISANAKKFGYVPQASKYATTQDVHWKQAIGSVIYSGITDAYTHIGLDAERAAKARMLEKNMEIVKPAMEQTKPEFTVSNAQTMLSDLQKGTHEVTEMFKDTNVSSTELFAKLGANQKIYDELASNLLKYGSNTEIKAFIDLVLPILNKLVELFETQVKTAQNRLNYEYEVKLDESDRAIIREAAIWNKNKQWSIDGTDPMNLASNMADEARTSKLNSMASQLQNLVKEGVKAPDAAIAEMARAATIQNQYLAMIAANIENIKGAASGGMLPPLRKDILNLAQYQQDNRANKILELSNQIAESLPADIRHLYLSQIRQAATEIVDAYYEHQAEAMKEAHDKFMQELRGWWDEGFSSGLENGFSWDNIGQIAKKHFANAVNNFLGPIITEGIANMVGNAFNKKKSAGGSIPVPQSINTPAVDTTSAVNKTISYAAETMAHTMQDTALKQADIMTSALSTIVHNNMAQSAFTDTDLPNLDFANSNLGYLSKLADSFEPISTDIGDSLSNFEKNWKSIFDFSKNFDNYQLDSVIKSSADDFSHNWGNVFNQLNTDLTASVESIGDEIQKNKPSLNVGATGGIGNLFAGFASSFITGLFSAIAGHVIGSLLNHWFGEDPAKKMAEQQRKAQEDRVTAQGYNWSYREAEKATPYAEFSPPITQESVKIVKFNTNFNITTEAAAAMISNRRELERVCSEILTQWIRTNMKTIGAQA